MRRHTRRLWSSWLAIGAMAALAGCATAGLGTSTSGTQLRQPSDASAAELRQVFALMLRRAARQEIVRTLGRPSSENFPGSKAPAGFRPDVTSDLNMFYFRKGGFLLVRLKAGVTHGYTYHGPDSSLYLPVEALARIRPTLDRPSTTEQLVERLGPPQGVSLDNGVWSYKMEPPEELRPLRLYELWVNFGTDPNGLHPVRAWTLLRTAWTRQPSGVGPRRAVASKAAVEQAIDDLDREYEGAIEELIRSSTIVSDEKAMRRIGTILSRLTKTSPWDPGPIKPIVIKDDVPNAFVAPNRDGSGRILGATSGLLDLVKSDDDLAGVLAHELAHVIEKHRVPIERFDPSKIGSWERDFREMVSSSMRRCEFEADLFGVELALRAGYDANGLGRALSALAPHAPTGWHHPSTDDRLRVIRWYSLYRTAQR